VGGGKNRRRKKTVSRKNRKKHQDFGKGGPPLERTSNATRGRGQPEGQEGLYRLRCRGARVLPKHKKPKKLKGNKVMTGQHDQFRRKDWHCIRKIDQHIRGKRKRVSYKPTGSRRQVDISEKGHRGAVGGEKKEKRRKKN